jgi:redox-regulated HSP33 family molecular chaperone
MMPDLTPYSAILQNEKWISKTDFIYRIKSRCDCSEERHKRFLELLYRFNFCQVRKGQKGEILIQ